MSKSHPIKTPTIIKFVNCPEVQGRKLIYNGKTKTQLYIEAEPEPIRNKTRYTLYRQFPEGEDMPIEFWFSYKHVRNAIRDIVYGFLTHNLERKEDAT